MPGSAPHRPASQAALALLDIAEGLRATRLWAHLGWRDIRRRYRGSVLGPFWITIGMGIMIAMLGMLYGGIFEVRAARYVPHLALGFIVWALVNGMIADGCTAFRRAARVILNVRLPLSVHVYRVVWVNLIVFLHNAVIFAVVAVAFGVRPGWTGLLAIPGMMLICVNGVWAGILLGAFTARFGDVPPIVESVMRISLFVTPIVWMPEAAPRRAAIPMQFNPFFHAIEVVRAPLLGQAPAAASWLALLGVTLAGAAGTFLFYVRCRRRIAYWL